MVMNTNESNTNLSVSGFILGMVLKIGIGLLVLLGVMIGAGFGLDRVFGTAPTILIISILVSAPVSVILIFFYVKKKTKHLHQQNIIENPDVLKK